MNRLQGFGFDVILFRAGEEVLRSLAINPADLLVGVGLGLPDMGTLELLDRAIALNVNAKMRTVWLFNGVYEDDSTVIWRENGINLWFPQICATYEFRIAIDKLMDQII